MSLAINPYINVFKLMVSSIFWEIEQIGNIYVNCSKIIRRLNFTKFYFFISHNNITTDISHMSQEIFCQIKNNIDSIKHYYAYLSVEERTHLTAIGFIVQGHMS